MALKFHKQQIVDSISTRDEIELYNCEDHGMNGHYIVAQLDWNGEVLLVGTGDKEGYITTIYMNVD